MTGAKGLRGSHDGGQRAAGGHMTEAKGLRGSHDGGQRAAGVT